MPETEITRNDIMPIDEYTKIRKERRKAVTVMKKDRRISCGPDATFYFVSFDTMWHQVHEMLYIEKAARHRSPMSLRPIIRSSRTVENWLQP